MVQIKDARSLKVMLGFFFVGGALLGKACTRPERVPLISAMPLDQALKEGEVRAGRVSKNSELLLGLTAHGRVGDFKIYNSKIAIVIAAKGRAVGYHPYGGTLLDADRVDRAQGPGQASAFGEVIVGLDLSVLRADSIEVINDGRNGEAARIRVVGEPDVMPLLDSLLSQLLEPKQYDLEWTVDYVLEPDAEHLRVEYGLFNRGREQVEFGLPLVAFLFGSGADPFFEGHGFDLPSSGASAPYYSAVADEVSYIYGRLEERVSLLINQSGLVATSVGGGFSLRARERKTITHHLIVGDGNLSRTQQMWRDLAQGDGHGQRVQGRVTDPSGTPISGARVHVVEAEPRNAERDYVSRARTDDQGRFQLMLADGKYRLLAATDGQTVSEQRELLVQGASVEGINLQVQSAGRVDYRIRDQAGRTIPAKISLMPLDTELEPLPGRYGEPGQSRGLLKPIFAHKGEGSFQLPTGRYRVFVSRGGEYEIHEQELQIVPGEKVSLQASLTRSVNSEGWMTTDTHIHSLLSPDSPDDYTFKVRAMVVENLELPVSTEHENIGDFNPTIQEMGLTDWMQGIVGSEITTFVYGHFNAFPLVPDFDKPGNGRVDWYNKSPAETFAAIRENPGEPFIQVNHPRGASVGGYFSAMGLDRETLIATRADEFSTDFDGIEVMNGCGDGNINRETIQDWFGFLNKGVRKIGVASTDNHKASTGNMGYPLTYVRMPTDVPKEAKVDDFRRSFIEGRLVLSCGPFMEVTSDGAQIGDTVQMQGTSIPLTVRVEAPTWMDVDRLDVIVNGEVVEQVMLEASQGALRFDGLITAPIGVGQDAWVVVVASGDTRHGPWAVGKPSFAVTNPIFVDGNGDGAWR